MKSNCFMTLLVIWLFIFNACKDAKKPNGPAQHEKLPQQSIKPGASNNDSLIIEKSAVVFFQPDSLQQEKIKSVTSPQVFESSTHEYAYQIRNGHIYLKANWPSLKIIDTRNARYLLFKKKDGTSTLVDLNLKDPSGMYLFDGVGTPRLADMMNIETEIPVYFSHVVSEKNHVSK